MVCYRPYNPKGKTLPTIEAILDILGQHRPMTVRQVFYQLVSRQVVVNDRGGYQGVSDVLVRLRQAGTVPWEWIVDRLRVPRHVQMWGGLGDFAGTARNAYRRDVWATQPRYFEVWLEKDALSGFFEDALRPYGVTLNVGRGFDGWTSVHDTAVRLGDDATLLYFGDFDPSGEDMVRSLRDRLAELGSRPEVVKCALTPDDIARYNLPPNRTKEEDSRQPRFVERHGDVSVELDALPVDVLRARLVEEVEAHMDMDALAATRKAEEDDRARLRALLDRAGD
jgi:hypothetical protein